MATEAIKLLVGFGEPLIGRVLILIRDAAPRADLLQSWTESPCPRALTSLRSSSAAVGRFGGNLLPT